MGRAIDLFVTYRFIKLLVTPFEKTEAFKLGIIDKDGKRALVPGTTNRPTELTTAEQKNAYTILHKLVFNIKKIFGKEFMKYLKEEGYELDDTITETVIGFGEVLPKGDYVLVNDILNKEEEELTAKKGDKVIAFEDVPPIDTILGVEIFSVVHEKTKEVISCPV